LKELTIQLQILIRKKFMMSNLL